MWKDVTGPLSLIIYFCVLESPFKTLQYIFPRFNFALKSYFFISVTFSGIFPDSFANFMDYINILAMARE